MIGNALQVASLYKKYTSEYGSSVVIFDNLGSITYVNETFCKFSGYSKAELIGQNHNLLINSDNQSKVYLKSINEALESGNIWHDLFEIKVKNGNYTWVNRTTIPFLNSEGNVDLYVNIYIDISEQKDLSNNFSNTNFSVDRNSIIAKTDSKGCITYVNNNFCKISGYSKDELIGQNHRLLNSNNQSQSYWKKMYQVISKGNIWQDEVKNKAKDGSYYWVDTMVVPHIGSDGKPESYVSIRTDITEQKKLADELIKHKFAMDQHAIIATTDVKGTITYVNDKFIEISGYSKEELIGQNHRILNSQNQPKSYWKAMYKAVSTGNIWKDQVRNISKSGSYYWVETSIIPFMDDNGKVNSYFSIRTDITYQKQIEEILSTQRFAMEQHSIIAITDIDGSIIYANKKFCNISGYTEKELIGQDHRILNSGNQTSLYWKEMYKTLKEKGIWQDEVKNKAKDGSYYWVDTTIVPFLDSYGKPDRYISIRTDISKYKKIQEELDNLNKNLELRIAEEIEKTRIANMKLFKSEKLASMGEMIGNISHQWRQPLSVISTASTGMLVNKEYGLLKDEDLIRNCNYINNNAQYLSRTIDDFKNFIKGDRTKQLFNLKDGVNSFLNLIEGTIKSNNINILLDFEETININGYENELTQCFMNIFNNSKDAFDEHNIVNKYIFISTRIDDNNVIIKIKDNAGGIATEILPKIFEPYFTTKHKSQGTGLGLSMTYNLITNGMKGNIEAENDTFTYKEENYKGATFTITLPLL